MAVTLSGLLSTLILHSVTQMDYFFNSSVTKLKKKKPHSLVQDNTWLFIHYFSIQVNFRIKTPSWNNASKQFILKLSKQNIKEVSKMSHSYIFPHLSIKSNTSQGIFLTGKWIFHLFYLLFNKTNPLSFYCSYLIHTELPFCHCSDKSFISFYSGSIGASKM